MKPLPPAVRNGLLRMRREGASFATISKAFGVPVGTVKSVCSKEGVRKVMEPRPPQGKTAKIEPAASRRNDETRMANDEGRTGSVMEHRGLRLEDMPGRTGWERRSTFALFKRGEWPPLHWHIPATLEGAELREMLMERAVMYKPRGKA
jgi:hypothetical protein